MDDLLNPFVWQACAAFLESEVVQDRATMPDGAFLLATYIDNRKFPAFYEVHPEPEQTEGERLLKTKLPAAIQESPLPSCGGSSAVEDAIASAFSPVHNINPPTNASLSVAPSVPPLEGEAVISTAAPASFHTDSLAIRVPPTSDTPPRAHEREKHEATLEQGLTPLSRYLREPLLHGNDLKSVSPIQFNDDEEVEMPQRAPTPRQQSTYPGRSSWLDSGQEQRRDSGSNPSDTSSDLIRQLMTEMALLRKQMAEQSQMKVSVATVSTATTTPVCCSQGTQTDAWAGFHGPSSSEMMTRSVRAQSPAADIEIDNTSVANMQKACEVTAYPTTFKHLEDVAVSPASAWALAADKDSAELETTTSSRLEMTASTSVRLHEFRATPLKEEQTPTPQNWLASGSLFANAAQKCEQNGLGQSPRPRATVHLPPTVSFDGEVLITSFFQNSLLEEVDLHRPSSLLSATEATHPCEPQREDKLLGKSSDTFPATSLMRSDLMEASFGALSNNVNDQLKASILDISDSDEPAESPSITDHIVYQSLVLEDSAADRQADIILRKYLNSRSVASEAGLTAIDEGTRDGESKVLDRHMISSLPKFK